MARKKVETRLEQGRSGRDYRVSSGHLNMRPLVQYFTYCSCPSARSIM